MPSSVPPRAVLFDIRHPEPHDIDAWSVDVASLADTQLLWIELHDAAHLEQIAERFGIPPEVMEAMRETVSTPRLVDAGDCFWLRACGIRWREEDEGFDVHAVDLVAGRNFVVSFGNGDAGGPGAVLGRPVLRRDLGRLSAASFVAARLHALLSTYFEAVSRIEIMVERIEQEILDPGHTECMDDLRLLLRSTSRLRRILAGHRALFTGLARPDFRPSDGDEPRRHFASLDDKYERAMDVVENSRDLVIGCFELFSSRTALSMNETMRTLTFLTVLFGIIAVAAGILGMNFKAAFFEARWGFWIAVGGMALAGAAVMIFARRYRWM